MTFEFLCEPRYLKTQILDNKFWPPLEIPQTNMLQEFTKVFPGHIKNLASKFVRCCISNYSLPNQQDATVLTRTPKHS